MHVEIHTTNLVIMSVLKVWVNTKPRNWSIDQKEESSLWEKWIQSADDNLSVGEFARSVREGPNSSVKVIFDGQPDWI